MSNMITILALIESILLLALAVIHFYWALGGNWGFDTALPTKENGERIFTPKKIDSLIVGLGLLGFSIFFLNKTNMINLGLPNWISNYVGWIIATIFLLRAVGNFKYVGFLKKVKNTDFAIADSKYFSLLSLFMGILAIMIALF